MHRRIPQRFTIFIACTGKTPLTISIHPLILVAILLGSISFPVVSVAKAFQTMTNRNSQLTHENRNLNKQAQEILEGMEQLESEIDALQRRAGMPETGSENQSRLPQGGVPLAVEGKFFLSVAEEQLPQLMEDLEGTQPALEATLKRENARPQGLPLKASYRETSGFGFRRNPFGGGSEFHGGLDFVAAFRSPIYPTAPGKVIRAEMSRGYGYHVVIDHGYGYKTLYGHMSGLAVTSGMTVDRDRIIGYLGNTGRSTGPHLHYEVFRNDQPVDPKYYLD
ncbi:MULTISPECIES: M23 family metallopeptidase [unclassified Leptolyngbya]|uniref:M23 family metallopeptidase n=1 Tax=unclassified Leptolyngbya TaxID=2650499 RepID=UPI00168975FE|nr:MULTISPECIES: M23 family metallopeptidase [unclassified Leptolyngbya]MBD1914157.1 peptidoglycan DD-metalloendopeptidase family protein [Leptolyngbya sp. FACHB-8]MBD2157457.1 peptidoglycan DD-metalloendopeptidase family protein [Leptolyngbya sp. FACHB-16]